MDATRHLKRDAAPARIAAVPREGEALRRRISEKAYEIFLSRGQAHGRHLEDWLEAERFVLQEASSRPAPRPTQRPTPRTAQSQRRLSS
jgi:Protein of unknown function (DUF2934)